MTCSIRTFLTAGAAVLALAEPAHAQSESALPGTYWKTEDGKFVFHIVDCDGGELCGDLVWLSRALDKATYQPKRDKDNPDPALRDRPVCGLRVVTGLEPDGDNRWESGRFYNPDDGNNYGAWMRFDPEADALTIRAYLGVEMLGKSMKLTQVDAPTEGCEERAAAAMADLDNYIAKTPGTPWAAN